MAQQGGRLCCGLTPARVKLLIWLLAAAVGVYILGPPLAHLISGTAGTRRTGCNCECGNESAVSDEPGLSNLPVADCGIETRDLQNELHSSQVRLLEEQLLLQEQVAAESQQRADSAFLDAKKLTSQYQKEAEKCNIGMETSEGARERAEAALIAANKAAALWEQRAKDLGWRDHIDTLTFI